MPSTPSEYDESESDYEQSSGDDERSEFSRCRMWKQAKTLEELFALQANYLDGSISSVNGERSIDHVLDECDDPEMLKNDLRSLHEKGFMFQHIAGAVCQDRVMTNPMLSFFLCKDLEHPRVAKLITSLIKDRNLFTSILYRENSGLYRSNFKDSSLYYGHRQLQGRWQVFGIMEPQKDSDIKVTGYWPEFWHSQPRIEIFVMGKNAGARDIPGLLLERATEFEANL